MDEFPWRNAKTETPYSDEVAIVKIKRLDGWHYCIDSICENAHWLSCGDDDEAIEWLYLYEMPFDMFLTKKIELYDKTVYNNMIQQKRQKITLKNIWIHIRKMTILMILIFVGAK